MAKNINTKRIHNRRMVSGALYDFVAYLTSLKEPIVLGSSEDCIPAIDKLVEWAQLRGLDIDDSPNINDWNKRV
jgi:hypothetical protein